ncbi:MAG: c-type cytochrome [Comamonadaceae bacterium]|jgi:cytochrome c553|uniref:c-type cytochrome n=1 Tax=Candidatus Skiveiella danica TaxID=3386177 RepID=UPI001D3D7C4C|nr:c-type cytochrome [Comamonadaceae bacterium]MBK9200441.1 c-type cytochrome [Betaproteobacteria bacterium]MBK9988778.1 c-type cytochrome [Betaproteobacteria bacterium]
MKRWIKWTSGTVVVLALAAVGAAVVGQQMAERKRQRVISVPVTAVPYAEGAQVLARGKYLYESRGCVDCHGLQGAGRTFLNDGKGTHIAGPNITPAGVVARYQPVDWVRTLRHGIKPDGRPAMIMPSEDYNRFTDADLAALVAHVRSLPPVQGGGKTVVELPLPAWVMYGFDVIPDAAQRINHTLAPAQPVAAGVTAAHGAYVANMCIGCHGEHLSGGKIPGGPPDWPAAANLTPGEGSAMVRYKDADQFTAMMRSGKRPDGTAIQVMPFESLSKMDDVDLPALYAFLKTLPPRAAGGH